MCSFRSIVFYLCTQLTVSNLYNVMTILLRFSFSALLGFITLQTTFPTSADSLSNSTDYFQLLSIIVSSISGLLSVLVGFWAKDWYEGRKHSRYMAQKALQKD